MEISIKSSYITTDITAVKIVNDRVLAGIGNFLHVFDHSGVCLIKQEIFKGQKIHGFILKDDQIAIYGGRYLTVLPYSSIGKIEDCVQPMLSSDWILTAQWLDNSLLALALAHNVVTLWDCKNRKLIQQATCEEKCILYSALLLGDSWSELVIFGGTVFSEVVIWSSSSRDDLQDRAVWHRLRGHKGVIFSVSFDPLRRRLLTSSDDRSVRVWQVGGPEGWRGAEVAEVQVLYGHAARVWRALPSPQGVVSIGEDSLLCQWDGEGQVVSKVCAHQGGSVWSVDMDVKQKLLVTGGGDGGLSLWPLGPSPLPSPLPPLPWGSDAARRVSLTARGRTLVTTEQGRLCWWRGEAWHEAFSSLASYALLEVSPCRSRVALATLHGEVLVFLESTDTLVHTLTHNAADCKILSLNWLSPDLLLTSEVGGRRSLWEVHPEKLVLRASCQGLRDKGVSAATLAGGMMVIGDQVGSLWVHQVDQDSQDMPVLHKLAKFVGTEGVTSLHFTPMSSTLAATGKDGRLHSLHLDPEGKLHPLTTCQMRLGWLAGLMDSPSGQLALAFHKEAFSVWNIREQRPVLEVLCGGGHRSWDFVVQDGRLNFSFVREKVVYQTTVLMENIVKPLIKVGLHCRVINSLLPLPHGLLVSGGDESEVRVWRADSGHQVAALHSHLSSVRALCCHLCGEDAILFSAGGRAQMVAWRLSNLDSDVSVSCLAVHLLCEGDPRARTPWADTHFRPRPNPETRYMALCQLPAESGVTVLAACSDSMLRTFHLDLSTNCLSLVSTLSHHKCCVLRVTTASHLTLSASCDGEVALWRCPLSPHSVPTWSGRVHQSGVNCLDLRPLSSDLFQLVTGGDDNQLTCSQVRSGGGGVEVETLWSTSQGHAAQITGVAVLDHNLLVTASIDQRVAVWQQTSPGDWQLRETRISTISDIQGLAAWHLTRESCTICVYGKGTEVMELRWKHNI